MKKIGVIVLLVAAIAGAFFLASNTNIAKAADIEYTCQPNGTFVSLPEGTLNSDDLQRSAQAMQWLKQQEQTSTAIVGDGTIATLQNYPKEHQGEVSGTFSLGSANYPVVSDASIEITSPTSMPDEYAGVVQGRVLTQPTAGRWIIQVYKELNGQYTQVPKQALADATTGEFTIDLSDVADPVGGWAFGILDAEASYAPYGEKWPSAEYYDGLSVELKLVTDGVYGWATMRAPADNAFTFPNSNTGIKLVRLVDDATGGVLAEYVPLTGLIRSYVIDADDPQYGSAFGEQTFVYDQAIGLFAALSVNDEAFAERLVDGMLLMQETSGAHVGGFVFATPQLGPEYRNSLIRTGAHAIATDALLAFIEKYPNSAGNQTYRDRAQQALTFIDEAQSQAGTTQGLYLGGYGDYSGVGGSFAPGVQITWASTEHNIDIWHAYTRAASVLGGDYQARADSLKQAMTTKLLNITSGHYNQGMTATGPDVADPLDVNSWGAIQLYATGQKTSAQTSMDALAPFKFTRSGVTGYAPFYDSPGYLGATPTVWFEGSYGVLMALARTGKVDQYRSLLNTLKVGQESDGSFRYATDVDPIYEISDHRSVAGTAWFVLATNGLDAMWNRCEYTEPTQEGGETPVVPVTPSNPGSGAGNSGSGNNGAGVIRPAPSNDDEVSPITSDETEITSPEVVNDDRPPLSEVADDPALQDDDKKESSEFSWIFWPALGLVGIGLTWGIVAAVRKKSHGFDA